MNLSANSPTKRLSNKIAIVLLALAILPSALFISTSTVLADDSTNPADTGFRVKPKCDPDLYITNADGTCSAKTLSNGIIKSYAIPLVKLLSAAVGIVVVAGIVFGGIQFSSSGGDPQKVANAKKHITNAIISLVAYVLLFAFLNFIIPGGLI